MGMTLDKLLDETGANDLAGRRHIKTAAAKPDFAKLAERCRRAATATPEERAESDGKDLAEKTAAVEIIRRTIMEIDALDAGSEKTAAPHVQGETAETATFIKAALEAGHQPEEIADFLEKRARRLFSRFFGEIGAGLSSGRAARISEKGEALQGIAARKWQSAARKYEGLGDDAKTKFLDKLRVKYGDIAAHEILKGEKSFQHLPGWKDVQKSMPRPATAAAGGDKALGINVGGNQLGFSKEQINAAKKPAMYLGAGVLAHRAITNRSEPEKKRSGVVVVNS